MTKNVGVGEEFSAPASQIEIRHAEPTDLPVIVELYNYYIRETAITFDITPFTLETRQEWFSHYKPRGRHRLLVAVAGGALAGYATSSMFRPKAAYETSVETSIYLSPEHHRKGIGRQLYTALFDALKTEDVNRAYAGITLPNDASIGLHKAFGFVEVGEYTEVGRKFGKYHDVLWMEKAL